MNCISPRAIGEALSGTSNLDETRRDTVDPVVVAHGPWPLLLTLGSHPETLRGIAARHSSTVESASCAVTHNSQRCGVALCLEP